MKKIILYSTNCPRCNVLESKLKQEGVEYETVTDIEEMKRLNIWSAPALSVDGEIMDFATAINKIKEIAYNSEVE